MSRYRKRYRKRRSRGGRWFKPYVTATAPAVGYIAAKVAHKVVKKYVNTEFKWYDIALSPLTNPTGAGQIMCLNAVTQGDGASTRDGISIKQKSLQIRMSLTQDTSQVNANTITRVIIFLCTYQDDTTPTVATGDLGYLTATGVHGMRNMSGSARTRYVPLYDKTFHLGPYGKDSRQTHFIRYYKKFNNHAVFKDSTTTNPRKCSLYMITISNEATNPPEIDGISRLRFIDN